MNNRRFQALDKNIQSKLMVLFPKLSVIINNENTHDYQQVAITVFDHWLTEDEAVKELNDVPIEKQKIYDARLHSFVCGLTSTFESYLVKSVGRHKQHVTFRAFKSDEAKRRTLVPLSYVASRLHRFIFVVPALQLIYTEGWDFTHHAYFIDNTSLEALKAEAAKAGVYVL